MVVDLIQLLARILLDDVVYHELLRSWKQVCMPSMRITLAITPTACILGLAAALASIHGVHANLLLYPLQQGCPLLLALEMVVPVHGNGDAVPHPIGIILCIQGGDMVGNVSDDVA